jgi:hypothetical protein
VPEESKLREVTQLFGSRLTLTKNFVVLSLLMQKILNFDERSDCNILHNLGIQCVTRFQLLSAQKSPLLSFILLFGHQL